MVYDKHVIGSEKREEWKENEAKKEIERREGGGERTLGRKKKNRDGDNGEVPVENSAGLDR